MVAAAATLGAVLFLGAYVREKATLGIDFTDGGAYVAAAWRLFVGDRVWTDELLTLYKPAETLWYWLFYLFPELSLYQLRVFNLSVHILAIGIFTWRLAGDSLNWAILLPTVTAVFFFNNFVGILEPGYNSISVSIGMVVMALAITLYNDERRRRVLALILGACLIAWCFSYGSMVLIALLVAVFVSLSPKVAPSNKASMLIGMACALALVVWHLLRDKVLATLWSNHHLMRDSVLNSLSPGSFGAMATAFDRFVPFHVPLLFIVALALLGVLGLRLIRPDLKRQCSPVIVSFFGIWTLILAFWTTPGSMALFCIATSSMLLSAALAILGLVDRGDCYLVALLAMLSVLYGLSTFYFSPLSSLQAAIRGFGVMPIVVAAMGLRLPLTGGRRRLMVLCVLAFGMVATARGMTYHWNDVFRDSPPDQLTSTFRLPRLRHIRSTPERVAAVEGVVDFLATRLHRGDYFLAFDDLALFYFLTETRPALHTVRVARYPFTHAFHEAVTAQLDQSGIDPRDVLITLVDSDRIPWSTAPRLDYSQSPLYQWTIAKGYRVAFERFPFVIMERRSCKLEDASSREGRTL